MVEEIKHNFELKKEELIKEMSAFFASKRHITEQYVKKRKEVEEAKKRIDIEPDLKKLLEEFQKKEQEKLVGVNQNLLTAILKDVIKNDNDDRKVVLDIFTERGLPALGIYIEKNGQGVFEDAYNGTGGAVANILSLGLRAIALIQSKKRRFLVLDEGDCWIKPEIIPDFIAVVKELSEKLGIQILVISHHDEHLLNGIEHRLILEKDLDGKIKTRWSSVNSPEWNDEDDGIRSIYLENFQSHSSTFIPLSKTVTLLSGVNDLGKSTIVNALRAVFYGQADDTNIKHFEEQTQVVIDFGEEALFWERKLKGKPKEVYTLINPSKGHGIENPLHKTESAREVPEWLESETGIGLIDGFDIQLGHQKKPVFLLDESASKKAKALSIGDETNYVQKMINFSKEDLTASRAVVKKGEEDMEKWYRELRVYEKFNFDEEEILTVLSQAIELNKRQETLKEKYEYYIYLNKLSEKLDNGLNNLNELNKDIVDIKIDDVKLNQNINVLNKVVKLLELSKAFNNNDLNSTIKSELNILKLNKTNDFKNIINSVYNGLNNYLLIEKNNILDINKETETILNRNSLGDLKDLKNMLLKLINVLSSNIAYKDFGLGDDLNIDLEKLKINHLKQLKQINYNDLIKTLLQYKLLTSEVINNEINDLKANNECVHLKNNLLNMLNLFRSNDDFDSLLKNVNNEANEVHLKMKGFKICPLCNQGIKH